MKIKLELEIPPRVARTLRVAVPLVVFLVAGAALAGLPHSFTAGETLTSADLNANFQNLDGRIAQLSTVHTFAVDLVGDVKDLWSIAHQYPAGWVTVVNGTPTSSTASCSGGSGVTLNNTVTLNFATPFATTPACTGLPPNDNVVSASSIVLTLYAACDKPEAPQRIVCVGP